MQFSDYLSSIEHADLADWVTVAAYLMAAMISATAASKASLRRERRDHIFWRATAILMIFLGINELLDLQTLLTVIGRANAEAYGWYAIHRTVQYYFVAGLAVFAAFTGIAVLWLTRGTHIAVRIALIGLGFIGLFILLRAASFHHLDELLGQGFRAFSLWMMQELLGIFIVAGAAWLYCRKASGTKGRGDPV